MYMFSIFTICLDWPACLMRGVASCMQDPMMGMHAPTGMLAKHSRPAEGCQPQHTYFTGRISGLQGWHGWMTHLLPLGVEQREQYGVARVVWA